ncbi:MAG TPA: methyltransferase domain-containing protein [Candidatus Saccharimonadales bacterium]|nr:methyltransferase domain-containing protein [Candidatus Saccharimonadales bacterium]
MTGAENRHTTEQSVDSYAELLTRDEVNSWIDHPVDFYYEGYRKALEYLGLYDHSVVGDVGCGNGQRTYDGIRKLNEERVAMGRDEIWPLLIGFEPLYEQMSSLRQTIDQKRFVYMQARGEDIPLPDNSLDVLTAHRVLYRADDPLEMLREFKKKVMPNGLIILTTNFKDQATNRYYYESQTYAGVQRFVGLPEQPYIPPARSAFYEDIPRLIAEVGGLEIIDNSVQEEDISRINEDRLPIYLYSMATAVKRFNLPPEFHRIWRSIINGPVAEDIHKNMQVDPESGERYFEDKVHRGMYVIRNAKPLSGIAN